MIWRKYHPNRSDVRNDIYWSDLFALLDFQHTQTCLHFHIHLTSMRMRRWETIGAKFEVFLLKITGKLPYAWHMMWCTNPRKKNCCCITSHILQAVGYPIPYINYYAYKISSHNFGVIYPTSWRQQRLNMDYEVLHLITDGLTGINPY